MQGGEDCEHGGFAIAMAMVVTVVCVSARKVCLLCCSGVVLTLSRPSQRTYVEPWVRVTDHFFELQKNPSAEGAAHR